MYSEFYEIVLMLGTKQQTIFSWQLLLETNTKLLRITHNTKPYPGRQQTTLIIIIHQHSYYTRMSQHKKYTNDDQLIEIVEKTPFLLCFINNFNLSPFKSFFHMKDPKSKYISLPYS